MRCPYCKENITIQGKFCPKCGEQIFGLPVDRGDRQQRQRDQRSESDQQQSPGPPRPTTSPTSRGHSTTSSPDLIDVDVDTDDSAQTPGEAQVIEAGEEHVGKTCPYCRFPIKPDEQIIVCPECEVPHHADCWEENDGCTTYGCTGGARVAQSQYSPQTTASDWQRSTPPSSRRQRPSAGGRSEVGFDQLQGAELEARANNALFLSILSLLSLLPGLLLPIFWLLAVVPALIAFFMAIAVLGKMRQNPALSNHSAQGRAIAALMMSGIFIAVVVIALIRTVASFS